MSCLEETNPVWSLSLRQFERFPLLDWLLFGKTSESPVTYPEPIEQASPSTVQEMAFTDKPTTERVQLYPIQLQLTS